MIPYPLTNPLPWTLVMDTAIDGHVVDGNGNEFIQVRDGIISIEQIELATALALVDASNMLYSKKNREDINTRLSAMPAKNEGPSVAEGLTF